MSDRDVICVTRGCGRVVRPEKVRQWRNGKKRKPGNAGPFCSAECYRDHRRDEYRRARREREREKLRQG